jgi:uncharacterized protein with ParB-like and HNH nuclease domain
MCDDPELYTIKELFSADDYEIPIYQRNYAWGKSEITQLIHDIVDCVKDKKNNYYIGTLIVCRQPNGTSFDVVDGQQRLTTLAILLSLIKEKYKGCVGCLSWYKNNLKFEFRDKSSKTLKYLFDGGDTMDLDGGDTNDEDCSVAIIQGYNFTENALVNICRESSVEIKDFCNYFFENVKILRVLVPEGTDLNRYFEIMNSRGEQLEQHEILKTEMLKTLRDDDRDAFSAIWEACSNMEKYVQYGFEVGQREKIFGKGWDVLFNDMEVYKSFENSNKDEKSPNERSSTKSNNGKEEQNVPLSIAELITSGTKICGDQNNNKKNERFEPVINFANFLLHILRIQTEQEKIRLDDKYLIESFKPYLNEEFVKQFGYYLLKGKFLFDNYIIKRDFSGVKACWSLKRLKGCDYENTFSEKDNEEILMLLSMFHVSAPAQSYKHWLNAALKYVFENSEKSELNAPNYKKYLEELARAFLRDMFLAETPKKYFEIIYKNDGISKNINEKELNQGTNVNHFIFNYLDYLLWRDYKTERKYFRGKFKNNNETALDDEKILNFKYTSNNSVEHHYPRNPQEGCERIDDDLLNNFGNLYLLSSSKNSLLNNKRPEVKSDSYKDSKEIDSIKQRIMMEYRPWDKVAIEEHGKKMKELLLK